MTADKRSDPVFDQIDERSWEIDAGDDDAWPGDECGRWDQTAPGGMQTEYFCRLSGTEFCDFECPFRF